MIKTSILHNFKKTFYFDPIRGFYPKGSKPKPSKNGVPFELISPFLRALLVTDGTVTKFLEAYLWEPIQVRMISHGDTVLEEDIPALDLSRGDTALRREILLEGASNGKIYTFAESIIRVDRLWDGLREDILQGRLGMGELLRDKRMETYRELLTYGQEEAGPLSKVLELDPHASLLYRSYRIFNKRLPTILIKEKFVESRFA